jgi:hypothetical protein
MSFRTKAHVGRILEIIGFFSTIFGLRQVATDVYGGKGGLSGMAILLAGVVVGSFGVIVARYNAARDDSDNKSERLAIETLAKLGKQASVKPRKTKKPIH